MGFSGSPSETIPAIVATSQDDPEIDAFIGRRLETAQGEHIPATPLYDVWKRDCADHGIDPGSQKTFSKRIQKRVERDPNGNRPRYLHVRLKPAQHHAPAHGPLRLAVVNG